MKKYLLAALGGACMALTAATANATDFSFTGSFAADDNVQLFNFSVGAASTVTLRTWSYAGGVNAAGDTIARGGFDPILALFDSTGALIDQNDDGSSVPTDPVTGEAYDTLLSSLLNPGNYTVAVMEYDNFANGPNLSDGFQEDGQGNFTSSFGCSDNQPAFNDVSGGPGCGRTNQWAFDILNVADATTIERPTGVPEPASLAILGVGLLGLGYSRRRQKA